MKILFPVRGDALRKSGGDVIQLRQYMAALCRLGIQVEMSPDPFCSIADADIVHLSNLDRPLETFWFYWRARRASKPIVLSAIHHPREAVLRFEHQARTSWKFRLLNRIVNYAGAEMSKNAIRVLLMPRLLVPFLLLVVVGFTRAQKKLLSADAIILLSQKEADDIVADFSIAVPQSLVIYNRIDTECAEQIARRQASGGERDIDFLCVGRIEPRKNQLFILRAAELCGFSVIFVGATNPSEQKFVDMFEQEIERGQSSYLGPLPRDEVIDLMCRAKAHVSASWFEVSSLVDIEAAAAGAIVLSSKNGASNEVLGEDDVIVVDPENLGVLVAGMREALKRANERNTEAMDNLKRSEEAEWIRPLHELYASL